MPGWYLLGDEQRLLLRRMQQPELHRQRVVWGRALGPPTTSRYELAAQFWLLHAAQEKPLSVPEQVPARYWLDPQVILEHVLQLNPLLVPEQPPTRYELVAQLTLLQGVHVCAAVLDPPCWNRLAGQAG